MRCNYANFPKRQPYESLLTHLQNIYNWKTDSEAELREKLEGNKPYGPSPMAKELIKEFLGE